MKFFMTADKVLCEFCAEGNSSARELTNNELAALNGMSDTVCEKCGVEESDKVRFVNLTPHAITILKPGFSPSGTRTFPPVSPAARVATSQEVVGNLDGVELRRTSYGQVENLPEPAEGTVYIVSILVAQAIKREDVVAPDTGSSAIRENGQIKAVTGFVTI